MDWMNGTPVWVMTIGQLGVDKEEDIVRIDRVTQDRVDECTCHHVTGGPMTGIVVNKQGTSLRPVKPPHVQMDFTAYLTPNNGGDISRRREQRLIRFWFDIRELNHRKQIRCAHAYFKRLITPEGFPPDYVSFIKKAVLLARHFPTFKRIELVLRPARPPEDSSESEDDDVIARANERRMRAAEHMRKWEGIEDVSSDEDFVEEVIENAIDNFITVLTPNKYDYQYLPEVPVSKKRSLQFQVRAGADAHIALSSVYGDTDNNTYEIVLGTAANNKSVIRCGGEGPVVEEAITCQLLSPYTYTSFWIRWSRRILEVGQGPLGDKVFLRYVIPKKKNHSVNCLAVSTGPGSHGEWEFVEKLAPEPDADSLEGKAVRRAKIRLALLWEAKRRRMRMILGEAYPKCLNTLELLGLSSTQMHDMMRAVTVLRNLLKIGHVIELKKGVWMRSHTVESSRFHAVRDVSAWPTMARRDTPTIAIVTSLFCEKMAVDAMMDNKITFVRNIDGDYTSCTVGQMGGKQVVHVKLPKLQQFDQRKVLRDVLEHHRSVNQVYLVGVGGGVPCYTDYEQHVRLGDVVISLPQQLSGQVYIHCKKVDKRGGRFLFNQKRWAMADDLLQGHLKRVRDLGENPTSTFRNSFEANLKRAMEELRKENLEFYRPSGRTDRLYGLENNKTVSFEHPKPRKGREHLHVENRSNFRYGPLGSGKFVAKDAALRMELAKQTGIIAFDINSHKVLETLKGLDIKSYVVIRGISDYADGSVNRRWHAYAALAAAAYTTMFLSSLPKFR